jgi:hypothetical protein
MRSRTGRRGSTGGGGLKCYHRARLRNATLEHGATGWAGAPGSSPSCRMLAGRRPAPLAPARASWPGSQCRPCIASHDLSLPSAGAVPSKGIAVRVLGSPGQVPRVGAQRRLLQARALRRIRMAPTHAQRKTPACNTLPQPCGSSAATRFHDTQACCPRRRTRATRPAREGHGRRPRCPAPHLPGSHAQVPLAHAPCAEQSTGAADALPRMGAAHCGAALHDARTCAHAGSQRVPGATRACCSGVPGGVCSQAGAPAARARRPTHAHVSSTGH